jgi:aryl-alcohol dehydrogenase-like predicted oxidoreductase
LQQRALGSLAVSVVGIGCNNIGARLDLAGTSAVVNAALDHGINFFDTADTYGGTQSEVLLGQALGSRRAEAVIATKFGMGGHEGLEYSASADYVRRACDASLQRLGTDYIDLYQLHFPSETPFEETLGALRELVEAGKVREIGCSNLNPEQLRQAAAAAGSGPAFASIQNQYSLLAREPERDGVLDTCAELGIGFLPYYPLANGLLTGKVRLGQEVPSDSRLAKMPDDRAAHWLSDAMKQRVETLVEYANSISTPLLTLAFSWLISHPQVTSVIAGASNPQQVAANAAAITELSPAVLAELNSITA